MGARYFEGFLLQIRAEDTKLDAAFETLSLS